MGRYSINDSQISLTISLFLRSSMILVKSLSFANVVNDHRNGYCCDKIVHLKNVKFIKYN